MDKEVLEYIEFMSKLLSGQLRGAINAKARQENLELIQLTMGDIWSKSAEYTKTTLSEERAFDELKKKLENDGN